MKLTNTSRYPEADVARLLEFAMAELDHTRVAVHVRNSSRAYRGRAYDGIPSVSTRAHDAEVDRLITIGIGAPNNFPCDNVQTSIRWVPVEPEACGPLTAVRVQRDRHGNRWLERQIVKQHGYGGKRSPVLLFADWREVLVAVSAHEARHIWQYQHHKTRSEVDAEQRAGMRLEAYRAMLVTDAASPVDLAALTA
jgi:hypothetical protein